MSERQGPRPQVKGWLMAPPARIPGVKRRDRPAMLAIRPAPSRSDALIRVEACDRPLDRSAMLAIGRVLIDPHVGRHLVQPAEQLLRSFHGRPRRQVGPGDARSCLGEQQEE